MGYSPKQVHIPMPEAMLLQDDCRVHIYIHTHIYICIYRERKLVHRLIDRFIPSRRSQGFKGC